MYIGDSLQKKFIFCLMPICFAAIVAHSQDVIDPKAKPSVFAPGVVSTKAGEFAPTFAPDAKTVYFTGDGYKICFSNLIDAKWTKPEVAAFSGQWKDMDPFLSPDGKRLFFSSYRPSGESSQNIQQKFAHIWYVERTANGQWSAARHLEAPVNLQGINNYAPAVSKFGTIYFYSPNRDTLHRTSYYCRWLGDHYDTPKIVPINGLGGVHDPYISADERFLIFASAGELYIDFRDGDHWSERRKLSSQINDGNKNSSPCVSPDGRTLYYSSNREDGILMVPIDLSLIKH
jgi:Tol biopolymer transport system component